MAALKGNWNFTDSMGVSHSVDLTKNKITIDGGEPMNIAKLKSKSSNMVETIYDIPNGSGDDIKLCLNGKKPIFTCNGIDVETGEAYEPTKLPGWIWVFYVLVIINFFLLIGGAIGGALSALIAFFCSVIAGNKKMKTGVKVLACIGIYVVATIVEFIIAVALYGLFS